MASPSTDANRREAEFRRYAQQFRTERIPLPPADDAGDYVYCVFYLVTDPTKNIIFDSKVFPSDRYLDDWITGFADGTTFGIQPIEVRLDNVRLVVATARPPGSLRGEVGMAFPRLKPAGK